MKKEQNLPPTNLLSEEEEEQLLKLASPTLLDFLDVLTDQTGKSLLELIEEANQRSEASTKWLLILLKENQQKN